MSMFSGLTSRRSTGDRPRYSDAFKDDGEATRIALATIIVVVTVAGVLMFVANL